MQEKYKDSFSNKNYLKRCGILAAVFSLVQAVMCIMSDNYYLSFEMCVAAAAVLATMIASEKKPESANLPIAATMMLYLLRFAERFFTYLGYPEVSVIRLAAISVLPLIMAVMMVIHLAMHISENRQKLIRLQQILYIIVIVFGLIGRCNGAFNAVGTFNAASYIISGLALVFTYLTLLSAEVRQ